MEQRWTEEQEAVIRATADCAVVRARAGTGKTSTLRGYARARPDTRFLYLVFNKGNQLEAKASFPSNVEPMTSHALAYRHVGARYRHKLGDLKAVAVSRTFGCDWTKAQAALDLVRRFTTVPADRIEHVLGRRREEREALPVAERLWAAMCDEGNRDVLMSHDGYLKLFDGRETPIEGYGTILFDEAQDTNPITVSILSRQEGRSRLVVVGDEYQAIYGFRGAIDALDRFRGQNFHLTGCFRFGPAIAEAGNAVLRLFGEAHPLRGLGGPSTLRSFGETPDGFYAFLSRTNAGVVDHAISRSNVPLHFIGGIDSYRVRRILDAWSLWRGDLGAVEDREFQHFGSYSELADYAKRIDDIEIKAILKLVEGYRGALPKLIQDLRRREGPADRAVITLTTTHRSKGLEFDRVMLGEFFDWEQFIEMPPERRLAEFREELNLLYVAATRARQGLWPNSTLIAAMATTTSDPAAREAAHG